MVKNQAFTKQDRAVFPNLHCFVGTTWITVSMVLEADWGNKLFLSADSPRKIFNNSLKALNSFLDKFDFSFLLNP